MYIDRSERGKHRQKPLGFPQCVRVQKGVFAGGCALGPPGCDFCDDAVWRLPPVDWQPKGALRDQRMTPERLKREGSRVGLAFVVAGDNPHFTSVG